MKTNRFSSSTTRLTALLFLGAIAAAAYAGPGPQFWNRPPTPVVQPAAKPGCSSCKTTVARTSTDRGPAGKGAPGTTVTGAKHECASCTGAITTEKGVVTDHMMVRPACATMACCR